MQGSILFQSTLPRRERHFSSGIFFARYSFQSTLPRRERQVQLQALERERLISIHTPTKGATAILTNNFLFFCSISLINFVLYLKNIQILFIFRYKFNFSLHILSANLPLFLCLLYTRIAIKSMVDQLVFLYLHQNVLL